MAGEVEVIKEKINLVDFLKGYLDLRPAGKNLKGLCPFHQEKTASFIVSPERQSWRCFGACAEGGDIFKFLMKYDNLEFYEALKVLAEKAGVPLQNLSPQKQKEFGVLYEINQAAKDFFKAALRKNQEVLRYLKNSRCLLDETIKTFELGWSPGGDSLVLALLKQKFEINDIVRAGLVFRNSQGLYRDKFAGRIVFPIFNSFGKTAAFTGRILPQTAEKNPDAPKYLNSPETPIFNKSKILYGFHLAKNHIAKNRSVFIVEGQMDVLMSYQEGLKNSVAASGTSLTSHHLEKLRRLADSVILSFDNDAAGLNALERSLEIMSEFDFYVKVLQLEGFKDAAEAGEKQPGFLLSALKKEKPAFEYFFQTIFAEAGASDLAGRKILIRRCLSKISRLKSPSEKEIWLKKLSDISDISETALIEEMEIFSKQANFTPAGIQEISSEAFPQSKARRIDLISERLITLAFAENNFLAELKIHSEHLPPAYRVFIDNPDSAPPEIAMKASYDFSGKDREFLESEFKNLLRHLQLESLKLKQAESRKMLKKAEDAGEEESADSLNEFSKIAQTISLLKKF